MVWHHDANKANNAKHLGSTVWAKNKLHELILAGSFSAVASMASQNERAEILSVLETGVESTGAQLPRSLLEA